MLVAEEIGVKKLIGQGKGGAGRASVGIKAWKMTGNNIRRLRQ